MAYAWKWTDGNPPRLDCDFQPRCKYHKDTRLVFNSVKLLAFPIKEFGDKHMGRAVDVHLMCPKCGRHRLFGVAAPKEIWEKLYETGTKPASMVQK